MHMNRGRAAGASRYAVGCCLLAVTHLSNAQILNLAPLPGMGQLKEILVPGSGQGFAGLATLYLGDPVIFYDNVWIQQLGGIGSPAFRFIRAHEYSHHLRGHVLTQYSTAPQALQALGYAAELDADCTAVKHLRQMNDQAAIHAGFQLYATTVPPQDTAGRPGAINRTNTMNNCLNY